MLTTVFKPIGSRTTPKHERQRKGLMSTKHLLSASLLLVATSGHAATVTLSASDPFGQSSFNSGLNWSDSSTPSSGNDYIVTSGRALRTPADASSHTFAGDSLTLGTGVSGGRLDYKGDDGETITVNNLILNNGNINAAESTVDFTLAGNITLAGNGLFSARRNSLSDDRNIIVSAVISGGGNASILNSNGSAPGTAFVRFTAVNTYTGNTVVGNNAILNLADDAGLLFDIGASGVNNAVSGTGEANFDGDFTFDLTDATAAGAWQVVDGTGLAEAYGATFSVVDFSETASGIWERSLGGLTFTFTESTGQLVAVPEPGSIALMGLAGLCLLKRRRRA